jgi:hypothetical protein
MSERTRGMHPPPTPETAPAGHAEAKRGVRSVTDIVRLVGNATAGCAYNDAAPLIFNDLDHHETTHIPRSTVNETITWT